jgi:subtilisin family serine protease
LSKLGVLSRFTILSIVIFFVSLTTPADAKEKQRLGSLLRELQTIRAPLAKDVLEKISRRGYYKVFQRDNQAFVGVVAEAAPAADDILRSYGAENLRRFGPVIIAEIPIKALGLISRLKDIHHMRAARKLEPLLNVSVPTLPSDSIGMEVDRTIVDDGGHNTYPPPWSSGSGLDVIFGVVDTGLDPNHEDFKKPDGNTRIKHILDQVASRNTCDEDLINRGRCRHADTGYHGTHVGGIAAGNGRGTGNGMPDYRFVGVAPETDIIAVGSTFYDDDIIDGVAYIFEQSEILGKPAVVNLSLGGHDGPHDGTDPFDTAMDAMAGPGQVVVVACGNEGGDTIHNSATFSGSTIVWGYEWDPGPPTVYVEGHTYFNIWTDGLDHYDVRITSEYDGDYTWSPGDSDDVVFDAGYTRIQVLNPAAGVTESNGRRNIMIYQYPNLLDGTYQIYFIENDVSSADPNRIDGWIFVNEAWAYFTGGDNDISVGTPGTAKSVITVGSYTTKNSYVDIDGNPQTSGYTEYEISPFSSLGPTWDGRLKPDIAAPGSLIGSTLSADFSPVNSYIEADGVHWFIDGTSMAAPHIAGLAALLLEKHATYTPRAIKSILAYRALRDSWVGTAPSNTWGYGKAHATDSLDQADTDRPYASSAELHPSPSPDGNNTLVARGLGFLPEGSGAESYVYQWQKHNGLYYENILGATYNRLEPELFSAGDLIRVVVTPSEYINGTLGYTGLLLGASEVASQTIQSGSSFASHTGFESWCMVSIPTQDDNAILGDFTESFYAWNETSQAYEEETTTLERGKGYWIEVLSGEGYMHSAGTAVPAGDFETPALTYNSGSAYRPGRHLIGNPFNKPIYWENTYVSTTPGSFSIKVTDPAADSLINNVYYAAYDNTAGAYHYYDTDDFEERDGKIYPWEGFWVSVKQEVYLMIPETQTAPTSSSSSDPYPAEALAKAGPNEDLSVVTSAKTDVKKDNWRLKISAFSGKLRDDYNYIGVHAASSNHRDQKDIPDAGTLNAQNHVLLYMPHDDWGKESGKYCVDMRSTARPPSGVNVLFRRLFPFIKRRPVVQKPLQHEWQLILKSKSLDYPVTLTWRQPPKNWRLELIDTRTGHKQAMDATRSYSYQPVKQTEERGFIIRAVEFDKKN